MTDRSNHDTESRAPFRAYIPQRVREQNPALPAGALRPPDPASGGWLTVAQVAKRLQLEAKYLYTLIKTDRLKATNFGQRMWRVHESDLRRFIDDSGRRTREEQGFDLELGSGRVKKDRAA